MNFHKSESLLDRAKVFMPGGVNSPVRSFKAVGGNAFVAKMGEGAYLTDIDGNRYIDLVCSWGALIHGHNHPVIRERIQEVLSRGTSFGVTSKIEIDLCEKMNQTVPNLEMLRLVNSGTEACMSAIRLARAVTKRNMILKFDGHYHGHADSFLVAAGSGLATLQTSGSAGVPESTIHDTLVLSFNDEKSLDEVFHQYGNQLACVILEVVAGNMGVVAPQLSFLSKLRDLTKRHHCLLIFDEVMTGYRLSLAGAQGVYGISPDLICLGKIIGGGLPVGAYGGRREFMEMIAPLGSVYQAGTLSGNPLGAAAGLASLEIILENENIFYQKLDAATSEWRSQMESHIRSKGYSASVSQVGSMISVFFKDRAPQNYREAKASDTQQFNRFFWALMKRGVYFPPSAFEACFVSAAHCQDSVMEPLMSASREALDDVFESGD